MVQMTVVISSSVMLFLSYRKIPIISCGLTFVQRAVLLGLFSGELIFGRACYGKEFFVSKWVGLDNKKCLKQLKTASTNSPWAYIWEGLLSKGSCLRLRFWGVYFREGYHRNFAVVNLSFLEMRRSVVASILSRGGYSTKFYTGRLRPEVQTLTLLYTIFERKGTPFKYLS